MEGFDHCVCFFNYKETKNQELSDIKDKITTKQKKREKEIQAVTNLIGFELLPKLAKVREKLMQAATETQPTPETPTTGYLALF